MSKTRPDADKLVIKATADVANFPPSLEAETVTVTVGPFSDTVPAGAIERKQSSRQTIWKYRGDKGRLTALKVKQKGYEYQFKIIAKKLNLSPPSSPVPVTIEIGGDSISWQGYFEIRDRTTKALYKYPAARKGDADGDGFTSRDDCDDQNPDAGPGLPEVCDGVDNDCDGSVDEGIATVVSGSGTGLCRSEIQGCFGGALTTIQEAVGPRPEICDDGLDQDCDGSDCSRLQVRIVDPAPGAVTGVASIDVSGTVSPAATSVDVNGVGAVVSSGTFAASGVTLREGTNLVTATASDDSGRVVTGSVSVTLDLQPPSLVITNPPDGALLTASSIVVVGLVNDIVVGTVNAEQAEVTCNGIAADVANRTFSVVLPLLTGANTISCTAVDQAGNSSSSSTEVTVDPNLLERITIVSGEYQSGTIGTQLTEPIVVRVDDETGDPIPNQTVIFRVVQNDGFVSSGAETARSLAVTTDALGQASATWTLGSRAGAGLNRVRAVAPGIEGEVFFCASAEPGPPGLIVADAGNAQRAIVGERLPEPLVAVVVDDGSNRLAGIPVTFTIVEGGGSFDGQLSTTVATDSDGRARAFLSLGPQAGFENNVVEASFPGNQGFPASFTASGFVPGDPSQTTVSGVVLDNSDRPVPGVTIFLENRFLVTTTDGAGKFSFDAVLPGHVVMTVDGTTALRPGVWPDLRFDLEVVPGRDNTVQRGPIYLVPINVDEGVFVDDTSGGTLTLEQVPGFALEIAPGSVTFPDGSTSGIVSATLVHSDKVPMTPAFGQQPRFVITIQPAGATFDPVAKLTLPNTDGLPPGQITEMYSFDHDLNQFVAIGTGSVSTDGSVIVSDPGVGVLKAGWHCGGNPNRTGSAANCPQCQRCLVNVCVPSSGGACEDGDLCTVGDSCVAGSCSAGTEKDCDDGNVCTDDSCAIGNCINRNPRAGQADQCDGCVDGTPCDDGNLCTIDDQCSAGTCAGQEATCSDGDDCTVDSCDPATGCATNAVACDDGNSCTEGVCFADEGCVFENSRAGAADQCQGCSDGTPCSDNDECTVGDTCQAGSCVAGTPRDCDDQNECTTDSCDSVVGCRNVNTREGQPDQCQGCADDTPCSDNNMCTDEDKCAGELCGAGQPRDCDDDEDCTVDRCEPDSGCEYDSREGPCNDEDDCTSLDFCSEGMCMAGERVCGNGIFESSCEEECDGDDSPDCPGGCSAECVCCDVRLEVTSPGEPAVSCVGETIEVRGTVSNPVGVLVNGFPATVSGQDWVAEIPVPGEPGEFEIEVLAVDGSCAPQEKLSAIAVAVGKIEVESAELTSDHDGDPDTSLYVAQSFGAGEYTVRATPEPPLDVGQLPPCWRIFGGAVVDPLTATVLDNGPLSQQVVAAAGQSSVKTAILTLVEVDIREVVNDTYGYSPPTQLTDLIFSNYLVPAKSLKMGGTDLLAIDVAPQAPSAVVHVEPKDQGVVSLPTSSFAGGNTASLILDGTSKGRTVLQVNLGGPSGETLVNLEAGVDVRFFEEIRVYEERELWLGIRRVIEDNDDIQLAPTGTTVPATETCVAAGANGMLDSSPAGDDVPTLTEIVAGPNERCDTTANGTDQIPVDLLTSTTAFEQYLNTQLFNQAVVRWRVFRLPDLEVNYDFNLDGLLDDTPGSQEYTALLDAAGPLVGFDRIIFIANDNDRLAGSVLSPSPICGTCGYNQPFCEVYSGCVTSSPCSAQSTAAHELGHSLGLRHAPKDATNIMYPSCNNLGTDLRALQWDIVNP